jgi:hypothetical protein
MRGLHQGRKVSQSQACRRHVFRQAARADDPAPGGKGQTPQNPAHTKTGTPRDPKEPKAPMKPEALWAPKDRLQRTAKAWPPDVPNNQKNQKRSCIAASQTCLHSRLFCIPDYSAFQTILHSRIFCIPKNPSHPCLVCTFKSFQTFQTFLKFPNPAVRSKPFKTFLAI